MTERRYADALAWLDREIALEASGHFYARECCANAWYAQGVCYLRLGDRVAARAAFERAFERITRHPMAMAGLAILDGKAAEALARFAAFGEDAAVLAASVGRIDPVVVKFEVTTARAALLVAIGDVARAARLVTDVITSARPGSTGWLVPIEPSLDVAACREMWADAQTALTVRAE